MRFAVPVSFNFMRLTGIDSQHGIASERIPFVGIGNGDYCCSGLLLRVVQFGHGTEQDDKFDECDCEEMKT